MDILKDVLADETLSDTEEGANFLLEALPHKQPATILMAARDLKGDLGEAFRMRLSRANTGYIDRMYDGRKIIDDERWYGVSALRSYLKSRCSVTMLAQRQLWPLPYATAMRRILEESGKVRQKIINGYVLYSVRDACRLFSVSEPSRGLPIGRDLGEAAKKSAKFDLAWLVKVGVAAEGALAPEKPVQVPAPLELEGAVLKTARSKLLQALDETRKQAQAARERLAAAEAAEAQAQNALGVFDERVRTMLNDLLGFNLDSRT